MEHIIDGFGKAIGMLFIGGVLYGIYTAALHLASERKPTKSRGQYVFILATWVVSIALTALVMTGVVTGGGCDSFDNCTEPDPAPQSQTWAYLFLLILVPSMIGLHQGLKTENKEI